MRWNLRSTLVRTAVLAVACAAPTIAEAQFVTYDNEASFLAAITNPGLDTFMGFSRDETTPSPRSRSAGVYGYTVSVTAAGDLFGAGSDADTWLSTNTATDGITFAGFTGGVGALGGNFFASNISGQYELGTLVVTYVDATGAQSTTLVGPGTGSFFGVVSRSRSLNAFSVITVQPTTEFLWPTVNNLQLGQTAVPEPGTVVLLASGLMAMGVVARRRRA